MYVCMYDECMYVCMYDECMYEYFNDLCMYVYMYVWQEHRTKAADLIVG